MGGRASPGYEEMGGRGRNSLSEGGGGTTERYSLSEGGGGTTRRYSPENTYRNSTEDRRRMETMYVSSPDVTNNKPQNTIRDGSTSLALMMTKTH